MNRLGTKAETLQQLYGKLKYAEVLPERIQILKKYNFSEEEISRIIDALRNVTNNIIDHKNGLWRKDYGKIKLLNKRYGTLPFAGLARAAFIAVQILQSLVACGILAKSDYESFMSEVNTVSSDMKADFQELSKSAFLKKYGHLRPGIWKICFYKKSEYGA